MKKLLFIFSLLSSPLFLFSQTQITDYTKSKNLSNMKVLGNSDSLGNIYVLFEGIQIYKTNYKTELWEYVNTLETEVNTLEYFTVQNKVFFHDDYSLFELELETGTLKKLFKAETYARFFNFDNSVFIQHDRKFEKLNLNKSISPVLNDALGVSINSDENSALVFTNKSDDLKVLVYYVDKNRVILIDSLSDINEQKYNSYKILKTNKQGVIYSRQNGNSLHDYAVIKTDFKTGTSRYSHKFTSDYDNIEEYFSSINDSTFVHFRNTKREYGKKLKLGVIIIGDEQKGILKEYDDYTTLFYDYSETNKKVENLSNFLIHEGSIFYVSNKHQNIFPHKDSLFLYLNKFDLSTQENFKVSLNVTLDGEEEFHFFSDKKKFALVVEDNSLIAYPAEYTTEIKRFDFNLKSVPLGSFLAVDPRVFTKLFDGIWYKKTGSTVAVINKTTSKTFLQSFPYEEINISQVLAVKKVDNSVFISRIDKNGQFVLSHFDGFELIDIVTDDDGLAAYMVQIGDAELNGFIPIYWKSNNTQKVFLYDSNKKNLKLLAEFDNMSSFLITKHELLANGDIWINLANKVIIADNNGAFKKTILANSSNTKIFRNGNYIGTNENRDFVFFDGKKETVICQQCYPSTYGFQYSGNAYFFYDEVLKSINEKGEIKTLTHEPIAGPGYEFSKGSIIFWIKDSKEMYRLILEAEKVEKLQLNLKNSLYSLPSDFFIFDGNLTVIERQETKTLIHIFSGLESKPRKTYTYDEFLYIIRTDTPTKIYFSSKSRKLITFDSGGFKVSGDLELRYIPSEVGVSLLEDREGAKMVLWNINKEVFEFFESPLFTKDENYTLVFEYENQYIFKTHNYLFFLNTKDKSVSRMFVENLGNAMFLQDNAVLYFSHKDKRGRNEVWTSTGSLMGTQLSYDIQLGDFGSNPYNYFKFRNNVYVLANTLGSGLQLWQLTDNEPKDDKEDILLSTENPSINFSFYPNPTQDYLNVSSTSETENKYKITVFGTDGKVISEQSLELPQRLDLSGLKTGVYLINVSAGQGSKTFRIVKQ